MPTPHLPSPLGTLIAQLQQSVGLLGKHDIQTAAAALTPPEAIAPGWQGARPGDDCAAISDGDRYLLLAAEGLLPQFVAEEPWFAGWCSVMVNISDIYAMGGTPIAVVDALWSQTPEASKPVWEGMQAAARAYNVPIVGGHTNCNSPYEGLAVAILGQAEQLITSFDARPGDALVVAVDLRGQFFRHYPFWNAATTADPSQLQADLAVLPALAAAGLCHAGKDISMGGIIGTLLMLMETSGCGAVLDLNRLPRPPGRWPRALAHLLSQLRLCVQRRARAGGRAAGQASRPRDRLRSRRPGDARPRHLAAARL